MYKGQTGTRALLYWNDLALKFKLACWFTRGKEGQDAMGLHDTETILHLTASSLPDLQDSTSLHDTASSLHQTARRASTRQNSIQNDFF